MRWTANKRKINYKNASQIALIFLFPVKSFCTEVDANILKFSDLRTDGPTNKVNHKQQLHCLKIINILTMEEAIFKKNISGELSL